MYPAIRNAVAKLDPSLPVYELKTLEGQLDETLLTERLIALLSAGFGLFATILAVIGLYGVMAFVVTRRTKELGVRLALGARRRTLIWLVMKEVLILVAAGLLIGVPSALGLGRFVASQLYGIQGTDLRTAILMVLLLSSVASSAGMIPAHRASRIDPITALRFE
jgi:ABC-type antimicrobial peptide transport system permease subunit